MADDTTTKILEIQVNHKEALTNIAQYRVEIDKLKDKQKELKKQLKDGTISQEDYHKAMESSKQLIGQYNSGVGVLSKQISNQLKIEKEQEGSLIQLRARLSDLTAQYDRLKKTEREGDVGLALKEKISEVTNEIKGLEEATQRYYRNVGNYPKAMAALGEQMNVYVAQLREMQAAHQEGTPEFEAMEKKVESLRETLATASDGGKTGMKELGDSISNLGMGFLAWGEILERAGLKNKDCEKTMSQMMVVITAAGTAVKIYNAVQKEGAIYASALQLKTMLLNTSLGKYIATRAAATSAEVAGTAATGAASTAAKIFNAILYANPLVWLIGIIVAAVAAIYGLVKAFQWFTSSTEEQKKALTEQAKALEALKTQLSDARAMLQAYGKTSEEIAAQSIKDAQRMHAEWYKHFKKVSEVYKKDSEEYKAALEAKASAWADFQKSLTDGLTMLVKLQTEQHDAERKKALGEYEFKRTLIREQTKEQIELAKTLLKFNKITKEEYEALVADLNKIQVRKTSEVDKEEREARKKKADEAKKAADEMAKKSKEEEKKRREEYEAEFQAAQDALLAILKDGLDKQLQTENLSYQRSLKSLTEKLEKYKTQSEYDIKMRKEIQTQIEALTFAHEQRVSQFQFSEMERRIKVEQELLQSKLEIVRKGTEEEMNIRLGALEKENDLAKNGIRQRLEDGLLTQEQADVLIEDLETKHQKQISTIRSEYSQLETERKRSELENEIASLENAHAERELRQMEGYEMDSEQYAQWRERNLSEMDSHQREILLKQEELARQNLDSIIEAGQLEGETEEQFNKRKIDAQKNLYEATKNTNSQILANENAKVQAMKSITSSLTGLLDTLGESNEAFAKMSKMITLAQIAIDTGKALSAGIASASSMPFPANLAAIATTVATVLANVATAIQTVKSAKFAQGGKVNGPGTGTSDSIPAMLSNGEFVMTAKATQMFEPVLAAMNNIGRGVPMQVSNSYRQFETNEAIANSFEVAVKDIRPVVSVVEITEAAKRVEMIESLDTF